MSTEPTKRTPPAHTPAPWRPTFGDLIRVMTPDGTVVAGVHKIGIHGKFDRGVVEANARLIAAAPDLLAALRQALDALEIGHKIQAKEWDGEEWDGEATETSVIGQARAAIAKAEGR